MGKRQEMQFSPRPSISQFAARAHALCAAARAGLVAGVLGVAAMATPAVADTPFEIAKRTITNIATIAYELADTGRVMRLQASADLVVSFPPVTARLEIMQLSCENRCAREMTIQVPPAEYSETGLQGGAFTAQMPPANHSELHGTLGPIDLSAPVGLVSIENLPLAVPLFVVLESDGLNRRPRIVDSAIVTLRDNRSGDVETLRIHETGPDTGLFVAAIETVLPPSRPGDGKLTTLEFSRVSAEYSDPNYPDRVERDEVYVGPFDPAGIVFDASSGAPVDDVQLTLIDVSTNAPAQVLGDDLVSGFPSTLVTGHVATDESGRVYRFGTGEYRFPMVRPGRYRLDIVPPPGFVLMPPPAPIARTLSFSSRAVNPSMELSEQSMLEENLAVGAGSFQDDFLVLAGQPLRINVPLARVAVTTLSRQANRDSAEAGDFIGYTVALTSTLATTVDLADTLPPAIRLVPGTVRVDGVQVAPVVGPDGRSFDLAGLSLAPGVTTRVSYTAQLTAAAGTSGSFVTQSVASSGGAPVASGSHVLRVNDAFDLDRVAIVGEVVAGPCGAPETGRDLSGIRILMEDGQYAITDAAGRFTFRDIQRKTRVLQLDELSLPRNARPVLCRNTTRRAGSAISQFVELRPGLMGRAEFHIMFDGAEDAAAAAATAERPSAWRAARAARPEAAFTAEWLNRQPLDSSPRILFPAEDFAPTGGVIDLFYLRGADLQPEVMVNGRTVDSNRRDPAVVNLLGTLHVDRWRAIRIDEGRNTVTLILRDASGAEVFRQSRTLHLATTPAFMELLSDTSVLESDGRTSPIVEMRLTDRNGIPLRAGAQVSVSVAEPFGFAPVGIRPGAPAHERLPRASTQAEVGEDGVIRLELAPVMETGTATFSITTGARTINHRVRISAADRPWVLVGLAEGIVDGSRLRRTGIAGNDVRDPLSGRIAFFAEGMVMDDWLLTIRYDSDARLRDGFYGTDPEKDYLVYGDASQQGNAAQSRFPLFLRLRKEGTEYLVGDFRTDINTALVNFNRRMTGARALFEGDRHRVEAFAARTDARNLEDRFALDGTTGPFQLAMQNIVQHSEVVRLVVTSRLDASEILETRLLRAGVDYTIDRDRGVLTLRRAIPAFTEDFDRNSLVVSYKVGGAAQAGRVLGLRAERAINSRLTVGATLLDGTRVDGAAADVRLMGADVTWRPNSALTLSAEVVQVDKGLAAGDAVGRAAELRAEFDDGLNKVSAYARRQKGDVAFNASNVAIDSDIAGVDFSIALPDAHLDHDTGERLGLFLEGAAVRERDRIANTLRHDARAMLVNRQPDGVEHGVGLRAVSRRDATGHAEAYKLLSRASWVSGDERLSLSLGAEYTIDRRGPVMPDDDHVTLEVGYRFSDTFRAFGSLSANPGRRAGSVATFGIVAEPFEHGSITAGLTRAAMGDAAGFSLFLGLEQDFAVTEQLRFSLGLDAQGNLGGGTLPLGVGFGAPVTTETFVTLRAGVEHRTETWGAALHAEARFGETDRKANLRFSADTTLGQDWTVSATAFVGETRRTGAAPRREAEVQVSAAHRTGAEDPITLMQAEISAQEQGAERNLKAYGAIYHSRYLSAQQTLNTRYGVKYTQSRDASGSHSDVLQFAGIEYRHDITEKLDLGVHGALMHSANAGTAGAFGLSVGLTPFENGWLSLGYNFTGFRDADFSALGHTDKGAFLQFRFKFDQHSIRDLMSGQAGGQ
jgi:uncharacterized repeat protein (TIGR01451 family)